MVKILQDAVESEPITGRVFYILGQIAEGLTRLTHGQIPEYLAWGFVILVILWGILLLIILVQNVIRYIWYLLFIFTILWTVAVLAVLQYNVL